MENKDNNISGQEGNQNDPSSQQGHVPPQDGADDVSEAVISGAELAELRQKAARSQEYYDQILRLQAEFDNARRRWEKDKVEYAKYACEDVVINLLNIIDNLERAIELAESKHEDFQAFLKGVEMVFSQMLEMLKKYGLAKVDAKGKPFDPNIMEALMQQDDPNLKDGTVMEELQRGYTLNNKVIRTVKVKVSKRPQG